MGKRMKTYLVFGLVASLCLPTAAWAESTSPAPQAA